MVVDVVVFYAPEKACAFTSARRREERCSATRGLHAMGRMAAIEIAAAVSAIVCCSLMVVVCVIARSGRGIG